MDDASYIVELMKTERNALGFIPSTAIRSRWIPNQTYLIQRDHRGNRRGYLLHGTPKTSRTLHVNQVCIDLDHRRVKYASKLLARLTDRAHAAHASRILLRCALDLAANAFWIASGFELIDIRPGGTERHRRIATYELPITPSLLAPRFA